MTNRLAHTVRLYALLDKLEARIGGGRVLAECHGRLNWPVRGVYFFSKLANCGRGRDVVGGSCEWELMR